ncbi:hypothetical protein EVAR_62942_1 [Eumeta japonica]|uniref:Uncharacterized protein n=1 Tax=Eumeta variegata TaxID=151549 RepID=A0A4C1ZHE7_EUMVA|nr:hypothetical protein EVAR_62942_1 [Eumeta japonica]
MYHRFASLLYHDIWPISKINADPDAVNRLIASYIAVCTLPLGFHDLRLCATCCQRWPAYQVVGSPSGRPSSAAMSNVRHSRQGCFENAAFLIVSALSRRRPVASCGGHVAALPLHAATDSGLVNKEKIAQMSSI